jgi:hypothetical protein
MPSIQYQITITNFSGNTPCEGYYIYTGLTQNIDDADYINGSATLIPITTGYTFNAEILDSISQIFVFVEHCDEHINPIPNPSPKLQGGYQLSMVDLRCDDCFTP